MFQRITRLVPFALWACLALVPSWLPAAEPVETPPADFDELLSRGSELERAGQWNRALQLYENFAKSHVADSDLLRQQIRHCEIRYSLSRRYHDASFRGRLLQLPRHHALGVYDEVIRRIEDNHVDLPDHARMFQRGVDNLLEACDAPEFRAANMPEAGRHDVTGFRDRLWRWRSLAVRDRSEARQHILSVLALAERSLGLAAAPVVLEFIYGACESLDEYSACLTPDRLNDLYAVIDGNFVGIGVELRCDEHGLIVVNVLAGGPAAEAGIRANDRIVRVGKIPTIGLSTEEAANLLQGAEGTRVELYVLSPGDETARQLVMTRRPVEVRSVSAADMISPAEGIGYIELTGFQKSTLSEFEMAVVELERRGLQTLILDLRGNPGGLLTAAVDICDKFLQDGVIVSTRGRADGQSYTYRAHAGSTWSFPLVVLIDGDSASASEIVAGAMQDHGRATIVGTRSYGKGSVQSIFPLDTTDAGLRLTTAKFFSPRGRCYAHQGVAPDIEVTATAERSATGRAASAPNPAEDAQLAAAIRVGRQLLSRRTAN